jgi:hypothetical protein
MASRRQRFISQFDKLPFQAEETSLAFAAAIGGKRHKARYRTRKKLVNRAAAMFFAREQLIWAIDNGMTRTGFREALNRLCECCSLNALQVLIDETRTLDAFADEYLDKETPIMARICGLSSSVEEDKAIDDLICTHFGKSLRIRFTWVAAVLSME